LLLLRASEIEAKLQISVSEGAGSLPKLWIKICAITGDMRETLHAACYWMSNVV
jgi:hypothetical protein